MTVIGPLTYARDANKANFAAIESFELYCNLDRCDSIRLVFSRRGESTGCGSIASCAFIYLSLYSWGRGIHFRLKAYRFESSTKRCNELNRSPLLLADRGSDESSSVLLERSQKAYAEQRYPEAAGWLKTLLQSDPGNAKAHDLLGLIYHRTEKLPAAEAEYRKAIEANPKLVEARYNLGISLFDQKKYKEAEKYLEEAAAKQSNSEYEYNLGLTCQKLNKTDKAIQAYQRAIKVDSSNALAHYSLGRLYHDNQKIQDAIQEYKKAIEIDSGLRRCAQ